jgi:hypothetical protein
LRFAKLKAPRKEAAFLSTLPLIEVRRSWGLHVGTFAAEGARRLGYYRPDEAIAVGVENFSIWAHELVHPPATATVPSGAVRSSQTRWSPSLAGAISGGEAPRTSADDPAANLQPPPQLLR